MRLRFAFKREYPLFKFHDVAADDREGLASAGGVDWSDILLIVG
jgi:hypothetical protein